MKGWGGTMGTTQPVACCAPLRSDQIDTAPYASSGTTAAAAISTAKRVDIRFIESRQPWPPPAKTRMVMI